MTNGFLTLRFDATGTGAERWADVLFEAGALSVDVADRDAGTDREHALYGEPDSENPSWWPLARLAALFPADVDAAGALRVASEMLGEPVPMHTVDLVPDLDWVRLTQAQFAPIHVCDQLWIIPSWCEQIDPDAINLRLDPGLAFGTGSHPTTRLCLQWLSRNLRPGATVVDYGCGSGILSIAAARLGAYRVTGIDIDDQAIATSRANAAINCVKAEFGRPETPLASADVLVANILAKPLELLAPLFAKCVRAEGAIVLSGLLEAQADGVIAAYNRWFTIDIWAREEGWLALAGLRRRD